MRFLLSFLLLSATAAQAQSPLGITGASVTLGFAQDEAGDAQINAAAAVINAAITSNHGFQGNLTYADTSFGAIGSIEAHLYMAPQSHVKYGLVATLADVDGRALRWATLGAEAMRALGPNTLIQTRAGIGYGDEGLDFIFAGAALAHGVTDTISFEATFDLAHIDEPWLDAVSYEVGLTAAYHSPQSPWRSYSSLILSGLEGTDRSDPATRIGFGFSLDLGKTSGTTPTSRAFSGNDPIAPLVRRGLW